jgi:hypothetical protein
VGLNRETTKIVDTLKKGELFWDPGFELRRLRNRFERKTGFCHLPPRKQGPQSHQSLNFATRSDAAVPCPPSRPPSSLAAPPGEQALDRYRHGQLDRFGKVNAQISQVDRRDLHGARHNPR